MHVRACPIFGASNRVDELRPGDSIEPRGREENP